MPLRAFFVLELAIPEIRVPISSIESQCPYGHFLFWNDCENGRVWLLNRGRRNALTGIFCFGTQRRCNMPLVLTERRNALTGIFCFGTGPLATRTAVFMVVAMPLRAFFVLERWFLLE